MHVCVLQISLDPCKGGSHLPLFAAAHDVQFTIVCNRSAVPATELPPNVRVITIPGRLGTYYYGCADFRFAQRLLRTYPPSCDFWKKFDLIHVNQTMGPALRRLRSCNRPLLFLIHHPVTADRDVSVAESHALRALRWRAKYALLLRWQRAMCGEADRVVTVSRSMQERIAADYGIDTGKIGVVPNGVDGDVFRPVPDETCKFDTIAVGSFLHPRKGFPYLLEAYKRLAASGRRIADVGRRSEAQEKAIDAIEGVQRFGTVDAYRLVYLVRHSRTLISTSLFEGFGLSLIEALACGHPAYAFAVGAVPEVLGSVDPSFVVQPRDVYALCAGIESYLELAPEERDMRSAQYRAAVLERYDMRKAASALQHAYASLQ
ncbi:glycosyltransferase family 4 protein [Candidatus Peribacteria bacterium]|nr:glycosyltransferase family 4 protein [Candidatus Peribacteria bacterium]